MHKLFNFGEALEALKQGKKVAREGWNGKGMFLYLVSEGKYPVKMDAAKSIADENGNVHYGPYVALKSANGIDTILDLCRLKKTDCLKLRNIGKKSFMELDDFLTDHNLTWGMNVY